MSEGKVLFDGAGPKTQSVESVRAMIEFFDGKACERLPGKVMLAAGWWLILSSKKNEYHLTSRDACSCKGFTYRRSCRHVEAQASQEEKPTLAPGGARVPAPVLLVDAYAFDTTEGEIEYWKEKEAKLQEQKTEQELSPTQIFARDIVAAMES